jgi:hypothetical protein
MIGSDFIEYASHQREKRMTAHFPRQETNPKDKSVPRIIHPFNEQPPKGKAHILSVNQQRLGESSGNGGPKIAIVQSPAPLWRHHFCAAPIGLLR